MRQGDVESGIGGCLKGIAVVLGILGVIGGVVLGNMAPIITETYSRYDRSFNWSLMIGTCAGSFVMSAVIYAIGVIVELLSSINDRLGGLIDQFERHEHATARQAAEGDRAQDQPQPAQRAERIETPKALDPSVTEYAQPLSEFGGVCPGCGQLQRTDRRVCYACGVRFGVQGDADGADNQQHEH